MRREISRFNYRRSGLICLVCACCQFFCTMFGQSKTIYPVPVYLMISCNYCTNPEPVAQLMKYKVSRALHAVTSYYTCMKLPYVLISLPFTCCGVSKGSALRLRLTGSVVQPRVSYDLLTYKAIGSNYLSFVVTSMLVFHIATG